MKTPLKERAAFPVVTAHEVGAKGMTYRQWLVGQIAIGRAWTWTSKGAAFVDGNGPLYTAQDAAKDCITFADAIIAELEKGGG